MITIGFTPAPLPPTTRTRVNGPRAEAAADDRQVAPVSNRRRSADRRRRTQKPLIELRSGRDRRCSGSIDLSA